MAEASTSGWGIKPKLINALSSLCLNRFGVLVPSVTPAVSLQHGSSSLLTFQSSADAQCRGAGPGGCVGWERCSHVPHPQLQVGRPAGARAGRWAWPVSPHRPAPLVVEMDVRLQRRSALSLQTPAHEKASKSQNKGRSRLASPAQHLARGLIKGNRAPGEWARSE